MENWKYMWCPWPPTHGLSLIHQNLTLGHTLTLPVSCLSCHLFLHVQLFTWTTNSLHEHFDMHELHTLPVTDWLFYHQAPLQAPTQCNECERVVKTYPTLSLNNRNHHWRILSLPHFPPIYHQGGQVWDVFSTPWLLFLLAIHSSLPICHFSFVLICHVLLLLVCTTHAPKSADQPHLMCLTKSLPNHSQVCNNRNGMTGRKNKAHGSLSELAQ